MPGLDILTYFLDEFIIHADVCHPTGDWTEWPPIFAWAIDHPEGLIIVDTGETARTSEPGYFPRWQPYFRLAVRTNVTPDQEIGPQLEAAGINPESVWKVILTHLHTDHAGGLQYFPNSEFLVADKEYRNAQGMTGMLQGYLPHRWPDWFSPKAINFEPKAMDPFDESYAVTETGEVIIVPTPGHTSNHVSVIVKIDGTSYFLAGDTSYSEDLLVGKHPDGVSQNPEVAIQTMDKILRFADAEPTIYLPCHDPLSRDRFMQRERLTPLAQGLD